MAEPIRLQKFIADAGVCSRREAEALIRQGAVSVNQETAVLGSKVTPGVDRVVVQGRVIHGAVFEDVTLLINKPAGVTCQSEGPEKLRSVFDLVPREHRKRAFRVAGELDTESEGLVVLTTDGSVFNTLVHPSAGVVKRYRASLREPLPMVKIERLRKGFIHEGERLRAEEVLVLSRRTDGLANEIELRTIHGRKREMRQLFDFLRVDLRRLRRIQIGEFVMKRMPPGFAREASQAELAALARAGAVDPEPPRRRDSGTAPRRIKKNKR